MEKVLKQVAESTLNEKFLELATTERRETFTEGARELAEQKVKALQGKLGEAETKLAEIAQAQSWHVTRSLPT